jgi:hypothetical protein
MVAPLPLKASERRDGSRAFVGAGGRTPPPLLSLLLSQVVWNVQVRVLGLLSSGSF